MKSIVDALFREIGVADHQLNSYNDLIPILKGKDSGMQAVLDGLRITDDDQHGEFSLDQHKTDGVRVTVRFGSVPGNDSTSPTIFMGLPLVREVNGKDRILSPAEARLRRLPYSAPLEMDFVVTKDGVEVERERLHVGDFPVMVKSQACISAPANIDSFLQGVQNGHGGRYSPSDIPSLPMERKLQFTGEDPLDPGGYFIVAGSERVLIAMEELASDRMFAERYNEIGTEVESVRMFSEREGYRALCKVVLDDGDIDVSIPTAQGKVPFVVAMKALGMDKDSDIYNAVVSDPEMSLVVYSNMETAQNMGIFVQQDAWNYLRNRYGVGMPEEFREKRVSQILDRNFLPHLGDGTADRLKKAAVLARMVRTLLEMHLGVRGEDDKDHMAYKRVRLSGDLMEEMFREAMQALLRDFKSQLEKKYDASRKMRMKSSMRADVFTERIRHAISTGNWTGGRTGVSQILDRNSYLSTVSHLRRVSSPLSRTEPHFEARDLHPTQWGRFCPNETPEGHNCGLVKNLSVSVNVSEGYPGERVVRLLKRLGMVELPDGQSNSEIHVNGALVGYFNNPKWLVDDIRRRRRSAELSSQINIHFDEKSGDVVINTDSGRVRRPLMVVYDGVVKYTPQVREYLQKGEMTLKDLVGQGIIEWLDAEEEEDSFIATFPYELPLLDPKEDSSPRCPSCHQWLYGGNTLWVNPGEEDVNVKCLHCGNVFAAVKTYGKEHTHMEIDPMLIQGVVVGSIPYPEHDQSPRLVMGAAQSKQSLGFSASNFSLRVDTRFHLLHYPQKPLVATHSSTLVRMTRRPAGFNAVVALMPYHNYNMQDAIVINKASIERGLGRSAFFRTYTDEEEKHPNEWNDKLEIPPAGVRGLRDPEVYKHLSPSGLPEPEAFVEGDSVIIGKTSPPRFIEDSQTIQIQKRRESSTTVRHGEEGFVESVAETVSADGNRLIRVKTREDRIPELGDKFASRHGQKGVVGAIIPQEDMPFTADGVIPDLLVNPHSIPSRMTVGQLLEMIGGKVASIEGRVVDGTAFRGEPEESLRESLLREQFRRLDIGDSEAEWYKEKVTNAEMRKQMERLPGVKAEPGELMRQGLLSRGFRYTGREEMYDGITGRKFSADVYIGVIYYEKLHHMTASKFQARARGPVQILTRQPTEGRARGGGLRFGEMERDTLIAHGAAMVLKDRLLDQSDGTIIYVCNNPDCGHVAMYDYRDKSLHCPVCKGTDVIPIHTSYGYKLMRDEVMSMGIVMRMKLGEKK